MGHPSFSSCFIPPSSPLLAFLLRSRGLDEFWFVTALFGPLKRASPDANEPIDLPRFTGSPLQIDHKAGWQGQCDLNGRVEFGIWLVDLEAGLVT